LIVVGGYGRLKKTKFDRIYQSNGLCSSEEQLHMEFFRLEVCSGSTDHKTS